MGFDLILEILLKFVLVYIYMLYPPDAILRTVLVGRFMSQFPRCEIEDETWSLSALFHFPIS
jgi:hypothetical protein